MLGTVPHTPGTPTGASGPDWPSRSSGTKSNVQHSYRSVNGCYALFLPMNIRYPEQVGRSEE
jgi:hypothetical protein